MKSTIPCVAITRELEAKTTSWQQSNQGADYKASL